ncbi:hypothetical protein U8335_27985 [Roseiconus lacunae]|uniref:TolC family protein n=1 Tax=Roseiconus lacunae TaxID=2605694 RepID=UPI00308B9947|nr:hypothetical protein U8335_27985 [Stieleria sp. HD01]
MNRNSQSCAFIAKRRSPIGIVLTFELADRIRAQLFQRNITGRKMCASVIVRGGSILVGVLSVVGCGGLGDRYSGTMSTHQFEATPQYAYADPNRTPDWRHRAAFENEQPRPWIGGDGRASQAVVQATLRELNDDQLLAAWEVFDDPRLRWMQRIAIQNVSSSDQVFERLQEGGFAPTPNSAFPVAQERLLEAIAHVIVDARYHHHRLQTLIRELDEQEDVVDESRGRVQVGSIDPTELEVLIAHCQSTAERQDQERRVIGTLSSQLNRLIGQSLTHALIDSIGDQPQLTIPGIDDRVSADRLRSRFDVDQARRDVKVRGQRSGLTEAETLPMLAFRGSIHAKRAEPALSFAEPDVIPFDQPETFQFQLEPPPNAAMTTAENVGALQLAMAGYHQVVATAASEVQELLTDYVELQDHVARQRELVARTDKDLDELLRQFDAGQLEATHLIDMQSQLIDRYFKQHELERQLGHVAIELFVALGGPRHSSQVIPAGWQDR